MDVEVIREQKKYIPIEKKIEIETVYDRPYEKLVEVPIDVVSEIPVPQERIVNVPKDRIILRPHRTEIVERIVDHVNNIKIDKIVDKSVNVDVPVYVEKEY